MSKKNPRNPYRDKDTKDWYEEQKERIREYSETYVPGTYSGTITVGDNEYRGTFPNREWVTFTPSTFTVGDAITGSSGSIGTVSDIDGATVTITGTEFAAESSFSLDGPSIPMETSLNVEPEEPL